MSAKKIKRKAILVEGILRRSKEDHLSELSELAYVADYEVVAKVTQRLNMPNPAYFLGKGKAKEIKGMRKQLEADVVIFENKLNNIQLDNLKKMWHVEIIDRFELILEIFINKAGTKEAITQIRLAALKRAGSRFEQHRTVVARHSLIKKLEKKLALIKKAKDLRRKRRLESGFDLVAIAGYTNAGKSTLMNALTTANVEVNSKMFTTLDTVTRSLDTFGRKILFTDTVGFISRLPHELIDAFYATLQEVKDADLILLMIDCHDSMENIKRKVLASMNTLTAIKADTVPLIPVLNKIDIGQNIQKKEEIVKVVLRKDPMKISAAKNVGIEELKGKILEILETFYFHLRIPNSDEGMSLISKIHDKTRITEEIFLEDSVELRFETNARLAQQFYNMIKKSNLEITVINREELERKLKKKDEPKERLTVMKTENGEEFVVLDLLEEEDSEEQSETDSEVEYHSLTTLD